MEYRTITDGLLFPEGPIAMPDGTVLLVEIARGTLTRVHPDGRKEVVAETGGGPNGAAIGPDGKCYVCNNGGFNWQVEPNGNRRSIGQSDDYVSGRIERVDLDTGAVEVLYDACDGRPLKGPNDIVFDRSGGFWFTDLGKVREREIDRGGVYYARPDGSLVREVVHPFPDRQRHRALAGREDPLRGGDRRAAGCGRTPSSGKASWRWSRSRRP